jgi:hypothetical protein
MELRPTVAPDSRPASRPEPRRTVAPEPRAELQPQRTPDLRPEAPSLRTEAVPAAMAAPNAPAVAGWTPPARPQAGPVEAERNGCTAPQLRRFIKSRAYVPMHELRRRFAIEGGDDDVTPVDMDPGVRVYVGLPDREGHLLGELLRSGDIGYELSFDPIAPIVVGVFPMRPVPRA